MASLSVRLDHLDKAFDGTVAAYGVSLSIEPGELFFLLGPSGCGKTTVLRMLAGFCAPDAGRIFIGDRDVTNTPPHRRNTAMVFQSYALWPHMTVAQNVGFGLRLRGTPPAEAKRRVAEALRMVRMADRAASRPGQLSGGQQQRVALARALVVEPACLLLDEPLSNLDARLRLDMRGEIRRICKEAGLTGLYVTHDQKEALSIADRLAVMRDGRILQTGRPQDVYRRPANAFVAGFIGEPNLLPARVVRVQQGRVRLATPLGPVYVYWDGGELPPEGTVTLCLRPEAVRFDPPPADAPNVFRGMVHHTTYLGEVAQHRVRFEAVEADQASVDLAAFELNPRVYARDGEEPATVWFDPHHAVLLKE